MTAKSLDAPASCKVYTPPELAAAMVNAIAGPNLQGANWLDPCVGKGAFLNALQSRGIGRDQITGLDIEPKRHPSDAFACIVRPRDFFEWATKTQDRFDRIVANPPYVRLRTYGALFQSAIRQLTSKLPVSVNRECNAWLLFLYGSLHLLRNGGSCAFVLPAAWDYADYAKGARADLPMLFREFEVHRSSRPLFPDVREGSIVVVGRGFREPHRRSIRFEHQSRLQLCGALSGLARSKSIVRFQPSTEGMIRLGSCCRITIGAVTGDSDYFLLTEDRRRMLGLPERACVPILSRARHLREAYITKKTWEQLMGEGQRVWLFRPSPREVADAHVKAYLGKSVNAGGCDLTRFKIKSRELWYMTPLPERTDGFVSGMSTLGPWISLNAFKRLTASNTLYVVKFPNGMEQERKAAVCLALLTTECRANMRPRRYADGLPKWEPNDLASVLMPKPAEKPGALEAYREAISAAMKQGMRQASAVADSWIR